MEDQGSSTADGDVLPVERLTLPVRDRVLGPDGVPHVVRAVTSVEVETLCGLRLEQAPCTTRGEVCSACFCEWSRATPGLAFQARTVDQK